MNIHRWRKLEGSDPSAYEMIQKVQVRCERMLKSEKQNITTSAYMFGWKQPRKKQLAVTNGITLSGYFQMVCNFYSSLNSTFL